MDASALDGEALADQMAPFEADLAGETASVSGPVPAAAGEVAVRKAWLDDSMDTWLDGVEPNWFCFTD